MAVMIAKTCLALPTKNTVNHLTRHTVSAMKVLMQQTVELPLVLYSPRVTFAQSCNRLQQHAFCCSVAMIKVFTQYADKMFHAITELSIVYVLHT
jgi:hypothetical protein